MKNAELIFIPSPLMGHLVPTLEFAKRLIHHDYRISITILSMKLPFDSLVDAYTKSAIASKHDRIKLIDLPQAEPPPIDYLKYPGEYTLDFIENHRPIVKNFVSNILSSQSSLNSTHVVGLILDFFCRPMIGVADELNLPSYIFLTSNAGYLCLMFYLTSRHSQNSSAFKQSDPDLLIPGFINPVPPCVLSSAMFDEDRGYPDSVKLAQGFKEVKGIIINTFEELEPYAISCFSNGENPPVYPVGPVLDISCQPHRELDLAKRDKVMKWLDEQPESSVVFLCFGTLGSFEAPQAKEMAFGLEQSGYRFLWSLRLPTPPQNDAPGSTNYKNFEEMLPEGFLERTQGRGMICGWAPQMEILSHKATGGFVSHCGWNSILESLWFGVPIVTWPMYGEQQLNAFEMVKELGLAVELRLDYRKGTSDLVMADEIEKAVCQVMDGDSEVRKKVKEMAEMARKAIVNDGSSFTFIGRLIEDMIGNN